MRYRAEIDGLRAFAVVPVILFHAGFDFFSGGFVGVDIFFVISGYLITSIILTEKLAGTFSLLNFYERRARRILPALFLVMAVCIPFAWMWLIPGDMKDFSESLIAVSVFSSNFLFWYESGYFSTQAELKPLLHTWSLAVEEQYYMLFPLLIIACWKLKRMWLIVILIEIAVLSLALAQWTSLNEPTAAFYILPTRAWELLIGALIAFYLSTKQSAHASQSLSLVGLLLIVYSIIAFDEQTPFPGVFAIVPTLGVAFIILFAAENTLVHKVLAHKIPVGIGLISYSAYLWHQPLLAFARHRTIGEPDTLLISGLVIASIVLAYFSWRFVEKPFRNKQGFRSGQILLFAIIGSGCFALFGIVGYATEGFQQRMNDEFALVLAGQKDINPRRSECHIRPNKLPSPQSACVLGNSEKIVGAIIGDSHADAISRALEKSVELKGVGIKSLTYSGCPSAFEMTRLIRGFEMKCVEQNLATYEYLKSAANIKYVIMLSRWTSFLESVPFDNGEGGVELQDEIQVHPVANGEILLDLNETRRKMIEDRYKKTVSAYLETGKQVILVYPIPEAGWNVPRMMGKQLMWDAKNSHKSGTNYARFIERNQRTITVLDSIGTFPNLQRVRPDKIFCNTFLPDKCVFQLNGKPLYYDDNHLNNFGAKFVVDEIEKLMNKAR